MAGHAIGRTWNSASINRRHRRTRHRPRPRWEPAPVPSPIVLTLLAQADPLVCGARRATGSGMGRRGVARRRSPRNAAFLARLVTLGPPLVDPGHAGFRSCTAPVLDHCQRESAHRPRHLPSGGCGLSQPRIAAYPRFAQAGEAPVGSPPSLARPARARRKAGSAKGLMKKEDIDPRRIPLCAVRNPTPLAQVAQG